MVTKDFRWLSNHLNELRDIRKIAKIKKDIVYVTKSWTPLKLIALMLYLNFYTKVIASQKARKTWCENMVYIDLLAGPGLNKIKKDIVVGSPLIAARAYKPFDKLILIEKNKISAEALELRLKKLGLKPQIFVGDCNDKIDDVIGSIPRKSHYLAFVDCEGLDVDWLTMSNLLKLNGDLIFNFQTQGVRMVPLKARNKAFTKFFGDESWKKCKYEEDFLECYKNKIRQYRSLVEDINVSSTSPNFHYNLIFATRRTSGGSPWFDPVIGGLKKQVEINTAKSVQLALDILAGRSTNLEMFF